jgi:hypothetical protein
MLNSLVQVDSNTCNQVARLLACKDIPEDREESSLPGLAPKLIGNFFLALVAICHQTTPRGRPPLEGTVRGIRRRGWDYLFGKLEDSVREDPTLLTPLRWSSLSTDEIQRLFSDPVLGDRLTNPEFRTMLLRDLGLKMKAWGWDYADQIYQFCEGRIATGDPNLYRMLSEFRAYNDPVRKKSVFYLALMRNFGLWRYSDDELLGPPVDYHEVRGHLRLGTVRVADKDLLKKIREGHAVTAEEDVAIRSAIYRAIMHVSGESKVRNPSKLHYLFWNLFRSICTREAPQCFAMKPGTMLPERYMHLTEDGGSRHCPFASLCSSAGDPDPICEHVFETDYY